MLPRSLLRLLRSSRATTTTVTTEPRSSLRLPRLLLPLQHPPPPSHLTCRRAYSSVVAALPKREQVTVPCRSNGSITIDILHAKAPASPIVIYLPSGPLLSDLRDEEEQVISALAESSGSTVVKIDYRFSAEHPFPTPIHDVLYGYDWVVENMLHDQPKLARIGVCGELAGASLATTLALTECELGRSRIRAAAVNNPIADWVFPDDLPVEELSNLPEPDRPEETSFPIEEDMMTWWERENKSEPASTPQKRKRTPKAPSPTSWEYNGDNTVLPRLTLSAERDSIFQRPEHCFDRFASPIHFFRSPHGKLIHPQSDHLFASSSPSEVPQDPLDFETKMDIMHYQSNNPSTTPDLPVLVRCRAYARIYPPAGSKLSLPRWHITSGIQSPLLDQASELAKMIKRSIARQTLRSRTARVHWQDPSEKEKYEVYAEERVYLGNHDGVGLWTLPGPPEKEAGSQLHDVGSWLGESLRGPD